MSHQREKNLKGHRRVRTKEKEREKSEEKWVWCRVRMIMIFFDKLKVFSILDLTLASKVSQ